MICKNFPVIGLTRGAVATYYVRSVQSVQATVTSAQMSLH